MKKTLLSFVKFLLGFIIVVALFAVTGHTLIKYFSAEAVGHLQARIERLAFVFFIFRASLYAMIVYFYPQVTNWFAQRQGWSKEEILLVQGRRLNMAAWLLGFEVIIALPHIVRILS